MRLWPNTVGVGWLLLSRHSVETYQDTSSHPTGQGTLGHSHLSSEPLWTDPGLKSGISVCKLISTLKKEKMTLCLLDKGIVSPLWLCWVKSVCMFRCNLPPALSAEWLRSFTCHCDDMGVERTLNKSQHTKLTLEKKILPLLLLGFKLSTFRSQLRCSYQQAILATTCTVEKRGIHWARFPTGSHELVGTHKPAFQLPKFFSGWIFCAAELLQTHFFETRLCLRQSDSNTLAAQYSFLVRLFHPRQSFKVLF